jgi:nuclear pore complex protein Nup98-Nup96
MDGQRNSPARPLSAGRLARNRNNRPEQLLTVQDTGAFGNTTNNAFGAAKPAFGSTTTTGGSLFGTGTATAGTSTFGGGGFGSSTTGNTSSPFGGSNTGGGLFGSAAKPTFGSTPTSNPFGGGAASSPFGGGTTTTAFGSPATSALGGSVGEPPGTGSVPFQAFIEKEPNSTSNQQNAFQSICFQQPYQKFSPEELRLVDYNQGRRYGNASNQPGAFGTSNFGGGFGSTNTGTGFGTTNNATGSSLFGGGATSSPFGASQTSTGFGSNNTATGGGLFGAKPATGGLFGSQPSTQPSGGLFGNTGSTGFGSTGATGGFGTSNNNTTGSSLFGNTNTTANKPTFSFGTSQPAASTSTGFGASTTTGGFGSGGLFGSTQQQPSTGFGTQQPAASNPFGGFGSSTQQQTGTSGGLFGSTQQKPAGGLFGSTPAATGTSLFGNTQSTTNTNPFGGSTNTQNTGGLFGNKPATTSTGLFGNTNTQTNTGGGLFSGFGGQNQNQPQQNTGGLFGSLNNNTQQKPSLFGAQPQQQTGGGLFGNSGTPQQQGGLFGGLNNNQQQQTQQPQNSIFGGSSLFGGSQQGQQNSQSLTATISDNGAFGSSSLFANLASTQVNNPGPIATPLSSGAKSKKTAVLPLYKLSSPSASRFTTPQKRGFGFSYSNYGTPGSASSTSSTPGTFSGSLLGGGSFGRTLNKSMSTSSLRRSFNTEDSILAPGAFSASPSGRHFGSTGSVKKLTINRSIRQDLFSPPSAPSQPPPSTPVGGILKKRVSFDATTNGNGPSSPLKQVNPAAPSAEDLGYIRPRVNLNGAKSNGASTPPEMEQVNNNQQLAIVNEEEPAAPVEPQPPSKPVSQEDQQPGEYYMRPSREEIENMNRQQRSKVTNFTVGRNGIGEVRFDVPVDLNSIPLDDIIGNIVQLTIRSATVYAVTSKKPPMGKGLNVPSTISLANSWPRKKDGKTPTGEKSGVRFKKHIERLKKVPDTTFIGYDKDTGVWSFKVEHFTTYGFPEDDEETDGEGVSEFGQSTLSAPPDTPTPKNRTPKSNHMDQSFASTSQVTQTESDPDDTFEFRKKKLLPGAFDDQEMYVDDDMEHEQVEQDQESFLDERSVGSQSEDGVDEPIDQDDVYHDDESVSIMDQEMAGSYPEAGNTAELGEDSQSGDEDMDVMAETPGVIMRARMRAKNASTPMKRQFAAGNDWTSTLKNTMSPQKQDRALLKSLIDIDGNDSRPDAEPTPGRRVFSDRHGFTTSIDVMKSLFGPSNSPVKTAKVTAKSKGFEVGVPSHI